jgi:hypothetical protein
MRRSMRGSARWLLQVVMTPRRKFAVTPPPTAILPSPQLPLAGAMGIGNPLLPREASRVDPGAGAVKKDISESEKKTGSTRLSDVMEATGRMLTAASKGSWTVLDGRNYVFTEIDIINQLGAMAAQAHRIGALFSPTFDPPKRRWLCPGAPVAIDSEVAISYQPDPDLTWQFNYRARLDEETYLEAVVNLADEGVKLDGSQFDELMKGDAFLAKGVVVGTPDRGAFRGTPSNRYLLKGDNVVFTYRAARQWLIPERRLDIYLATYTKVAADGANAWLDRIERALVVI